MKSDQNPVQNITPAPLQEIKEILRRFDKKPLRAVRLLSWIQENIDRLIEEDEKRINQMRESHQMQLDEMLNQEKMN